MATPNLRTELPPGFSGQVKPSFDLADRRGEQQLAETIGGMAAKHWANIIQARTANEVAAFRGVMRTEQALLEKELRARPGMAIEEYDELKNRMNTNIKKAAGNATTRGGKQRNRELYDRDAKAISERVDATRNAIVSNQELSVFNLNREKWIETGDLAGLKEGWEGMSGNLFGAEQVELMLRNDTAVLLEGTILRQALAMPEAAEGAEWIAGANKVATEQYQIKGELFSPDDLARMKDAYETTRKDAQASIEKAAKQQSEQTETQLTLDIYDPKIPSATTRQKIRDAGKVGLLDGTQIRVLMNTLDANRDNAGKDTSPGTNITINQIESDVRNEKLTRHEGLQKYLKLTPQIRSSENKGNIDRIFKASEPDDPLKSPGSEIYLTKLGNLYEDETIDAQEYDEMYGELSNWLKANPEATPSQRADKYVETTGGAIKNWLEKWPINWLTFKQRYSFRAGQFIGKSLGLGAEKDEEKELSEMTDEELRAVVEGK